MRKLIENLREKPDHHKRRIAVGVSALATFLVFAFWVSVILPGNTARLAGHEKQGESPFGNIKKSVAGAVEGIRQVGEPIKDLESEYQKMKEQVESGQIKLVPAQE